MTDAPNQYTLPSVYLEEKKTPIRTEAFEDNDETIHSDRTFVGRYIPTPLERLSTKFFEKFDTQQTGRLCITHVFGILKSLYRSIEIEGEISIDEIRFFLHGLGRDEEGLDLEEFTIFVGRAIDARGVKLV